MKIKLFADTADLDEMRSLNVDGFTTNPTLMRRAGVSDYAGFARAALAVAAGRPISFEVVGRDIVEEALLIGNWAPNVYVKVPVTYRNEIRTLLQKGVPLNITAICNPADAHGLVPQNNPTPVIVSVFAGRIADTGRSAFAAMRHLRSVLPPQAQLLWASTRELYNIIEAEQAGCDIITVTPAILAKLNWLDRDLNEVTQATVLQFTKDATIAGYTL